MKVIPSIIVLFIGSCQFPFSNAGADKLPIDDGRIQVAKCLGNSLSWQTDKFEGTEAHLFELCNMSDSNNLYIQDLLKEKNLNPEKVYEEIRNCLGDRAKQLITRYRNSLPSDIKELEGKPKLPKINEMVLGLCETKEFVEFYKLSEEEKPQSIECLRTCAANLFEKFVLMHKIFKNNYDKMIESGQIEPLMQIDSSKQKDINEDATGELKELDQTKVSPGKFQLRKTIKGYVDECKNKIKTDKSLLNIIGAEYTKAYIQDLDKLYEICPCKEEKDKLLISIESYFACVRWTCTMKTEKDIPFRDLLEKVMDNISDDELLVFAR